MSLESDIAILRKAPLFQDLESDQLRLLAFGAERRRLRENEYVFREAARSDAGFVIISGAVTLVRGRAERERVVGRHGPGTLLGTLALITETRRPVSARTDTATELMRIGRPLFRRLLEEYPDFAAALHARLAEELADFTSEVGAMHPRFAD